MLPGNTTKDDFNSELCYEDAEETDTENVEEDMNLFPTENLNQIPPAEPQLNVSKSHWYICKIRNPTKKPKQTPPSKTH